MSLTLSFQRQPLYLQVTLFGHTAHAPASVLLVRKTKRRAWRPLSRSANRRSSTGKNARQNNACKCWKGSLESRSFALRVRSAGGGRASSGKAFGGVGRFRKLKKPVDDVAKVLHNLVSLLLMQRRRTKRCRVVVKVMQRGAVSVVNA